MNVSTLELHTAYSPPLIMASNNRKRCTDESVHKLLREKFIVLMGGTVDRLKYSPEASELFHEELDLFKKKLNNFEKCARLIVRKYDELKTVNYSLEKLNAERSKLLRHVNTVMEETQLNCLDEATFVNLLNENARNIEGLDKGLDEASGK
ncbi:uncharacterized protein LOC119689782 [Teleopsis dalmanni]|uniref:uncharacterized protein LOC119689782 n=1 Tax=Teleopsis dalmanni TaxID=139649 RepID=UPI0018CD474E|nr:uncharacterized protein LOC119689782 [Teleopsis dalmanni]